jgi:hypothetical protein
VHVRRARPDEIEVVLAVLAHESVQSRYEKRVGDVIA